MSLRGPGGRFSKAPETFRARNAIAKSRTLPLQSCFIHIFLTWREVPFIQEVSGVFTSPFLDTDDLKMALRARKLSGAFERRAPGHAILGNFSTDQLVIELTKTHIKITAQNCRRTLTKHGKAKRGHGWTKLKRIKMNCIWINLKNVGPPFFQIYGVSFSL